MEYRESPHLPVHQDFERENSIRGSARLAFPIHHGLFLREDDLAVDLPASVGLDISPMDYAGGIVLFWVPYLSQLDYSFEDWQSNPAGTRLALLSVLDWEEVQVSARTMNQRHAGTSRLSTAYSRARSLFFKSSLLASQIIEVEAMHGMPLAFHGGMPTAATVGSLFTGACFLKTTLYSSVAGYGSGVKKPAADELSVPEPTWREPIG